MKINKCAASAMKRSSGENEALAQERAVVGKLARGLITPAMSQAENDRIIDALVRVFSEERVVVVEQAHLLITPEMTAFERVLLIDAVARVPSARRAAVIEKSHQLIIPAMIIAERLVIMSLIEMGGDAEEFAASIEQARLLLTPAMTYDHRQSIIRAVADVSAEKRADVVEEVSKAITSAMSDEDRIKLIQAASVVPSGEREGFIALTVSQIIPQLITPDMNYLLRYDIFFSIAQIPVQERHDFIIQALELIAFEMGPRMRRDIIQALAKVPAEERVAVIEQVRNTITPEMDSLTQYVITIAAAAVSVQERRDFITQILQLITPEMDSLMRYDIIRALAQVAAEERAAVIEQVRNAITPEMDSLTQYAITVAAAAVPAAERAGFIALTAEWIIPELFTPEMDLALRFYIISSVATVPAQEMDAFIAQVRGAITPAMSGWDREAIVRRQAEIVQRAHQPPEEREEIVRRHGVNVHEGDRDQRAKKALESLRAAQPGLSDNQIASAKDQFIAYLENALVADEVKELARHALLAPKEPDESFGPLLDQEGFTLLGLRTSGEELIGRLWIFASRLSEPEQTNAKMGMITALLDSYDAFGRVCNQGKTHRLLIAVLQGRLAGVNIDGGVATIQVPTSQAMTMFFQVQAHQEIEELQALLAAAEAFCRENPNVEREAFLQEIREYAAQQGIE